MAQGIGRVVRTGSGMDMVCEDLMVSCRSLLPSLSSENFETCRYVVISVV